MYEFERLDTKEYSWVTKTSHHLEIKCCLIWLNEWILWRHSLCLTVSLMSASKLDAALWFRKSTKPCPSCHSSLTVHPHFNDLLISSNQLANLHGGKSHQTTLFFLQTALRTADSSNEKKSFWILNFSEILDLVALTGILILF